MTADRHIYTLKRPASWYGQAWREALPLGNGLTGVLIPGAIAGESIQFNRYDLWEGGSDGEIPDISHAFREMRESILAGDYVRANQDNIMRAAREKGYSALAETPRPLGWLKLSFEPDGIFTDYRRGINMRTGEAFVEFSAGGHRYSRKAFVSRDADVTVMRMTSDAPFTVVYTPELFGGSSETVFGGREISAVSGDAGMIVAFAGDVRVSEEGGGAAVTGRDYVILVGCSSRGSKTDPGRYTGESYESLLAKHAAIHTPLYDSADIRLADDGDFGLTNEEMLDQAYDGRMSPAFIERFWRFGRYLFISAASEKGYPIPLYGLWHGGAKLPWSQYVANENVEMTYWHALPGGLSYALPPLIRYYASKTEKFRECAKKIFGMNGIWISAYTTPNAAGLCVPVAVIANWISCAGWLCRHFWEYYLYSGDEKLLKEEILPFMREAALFYRDYALYEDGRMQLVPSVSPENTPENLTRLATTSASGHPCPAVKNAVMDFAVIKELLTNLLSGMEITGMYPGEADDYRRMLGAIPDYMINSDGAVKEWMSGELDDNYHHRHLSHIYPVFPGGEVTRSSDPELFSAFRRAVELRVLGSQSGWSLTHMANIYARFGEAEKAAGCLDVMAKSVVLPSLFTLHNDWRRMGMTLDWQDSAVVQLDAVFGAVSAVQEMLFRCEKDALVILPALPLRLGSGSVSGMAFPGGAVDISWNENGVRISVSASKDIRTKLIVRGTDCGGISLSAGETRTISRGL